MLDASDVLPKIIKMTQPSFALKQIAQILVLVLDRITQLPSPWLEASTVIITWLTIHKADPVVETIFKMNPAIQKDLARVHKLLENQCHKEMHMNKDDDL